jgi:hypothetical protein
MSVQRDKSGPRSYDRQRPLMTWQTSRFVAAMFAVMEHTPKRSPMTDLVRATAPVRASCQPPGRAQKPSSARPIQLNANRQQTPAAAEAKVAIVLAVGMTRTLCGQRSNSVRQLLPENDENLPETRKGLAVTALQQEHGLPAKTRNRWLSRESDGDFSACIV